MCCFNCFKRQAKKKKHEPKKPPEHSNQKLTPTLIDSTGKSFSRPQIKLTSSPQPATPTKTTKSTVSYSPSSPSAIKTTELTEVFRHDNKTQATRLTSKDYPDIAALHGYELGQMLGQGAYASVYRAKRLSDGQMLACKVMMVANPKDLLSAKNELFILQRTKHPHIVKLYHVSVVRLQNCQTHKKPNLFSLLKA